MLQTVEKECSFSSAEHQGERAVFLFLHGDCRVNPFYSPGKIKKKNAVRDLPQ